MGRGRNADRPSEIPKEGLYDVAMRIWRRQGSTNVALVAAGVAFYGILSIFPAITAIVALAGLFFEPSILISRSAEIAEFLPNQAQDIIIGQMREVVSADSASLSLALLFTVGLSLYSANKATANLITGLNIIYEQDETRGFVGLLIRTISLTAALIIGFIFAVLIVAALPAVAEFARHLPLADSAILVLRWVILFVVGIVGVGIMYRFGPDRRPAKWRWLTPGAVMACLLWVVGSYGFSLYVQSFGNYNETFGALAGVIVLLTWLWISAYIILLGALVDAELEAQTKIDSTIGEDRPMGERGATKADTLGKARNA